MIQNSNNISFYLLLFSEFLSNLLTGITGIALTFYILSLGGTAASSAGILGLTYIPSAAAIFISPLLDKLPIRLPLIIANIFRAAILIALYLVMQYGNSQSVTILIYISAIINGLFGAIYTPALMRAIPKLVSEEKMVSSITLANGIIQSSSLLGLAFAGIIIKYLGSANVIYINGQILFITVFILFFIKSDKERTNTEIPTGSIKESWGILNINPTTRIIPYLAFLINSTFALVLARLPIHLKNLGLGTGEFGIFELSMILGVILGSIAFNIINNNKLKYIWLLALGLLIASIALLFSTFFTTNYIILIATNTIFGLGLGLTNNAIQVIIAQEIPEEFHGRVYSIFTTAGQLGIPVMLLFSMTFINKVTLSEVYFFNFCIIYLSSIVVYLIGRNNKDGTSN